MKSSGRDKVPAPSEAFVIAWCLTMGVILSLIVISAGMSGCASPKREIEKAATFATIEAGSAITALDKATASGEVGPKAAPFVAEAKAHMGNVLGAASSITSNLPGVKDVEGWWVAWIKTGLIGAAAIACFYFLWPVLPGVIAWIVVKFPKMLWIIPRAVRATAKFEAEALSEPNAPDVLKQSVAVKRVKSPFYEAAFKVAKQGVRI